jgi:hypothetical protein
MECYEQMYQMLLFMLQRQYLLITIYLEARGSVVVKALCYKLEGLWFDARCGDVLNLPNPSGRTRPWGLLSL